MSLPKNDEKSGATKSEKESNKASSQESSNVPSSVGEKESSTEELLKILAEGNLSEVKSFQKESGQLKCLSYSGRCCDTQRCS